jgi:hypothetical protein
MDRRQFDRAADQQPPAGFVFVLLLVVTISLVLALTVLWR